MIDTHPALLLALTFVAGCASASPPPTTAGPEAASHLAVEVATAPAPMHLGGASHLVWELTLRNPGDTPVTVTALEVLGDGAPLAAFEAAALAGRWHLFAAAPPAEGADAPPKGVVPPGDTAIIYLWHTAPSDAALPAHLIHRVTVTAAGGDVTVRDLAPIDVLGVDTVPVLGPPLAGEGWFVVNSPSDTSRHRRSVQLIDGGLYTAQRYAVDLVRVLTPEGTHAGDPAVNANYSAYGAELLAMADGVVVAVKDGIPENVPGAAARAVPITYDTLAGNYVVLDIGGDRYVTYAHVQPGSLRVTTGQRVARGDVLGLLGNSGNSTEPHLHLHVCDAPSALRCHGRPWALARFVEQEVKLPTPPTAGPPTVTDPIVREGAIPVNMGYLKLSGSDDGPPAVPSP